MQEFIFFLLQNINNHKILSKLRYLNKNFKLSEIEEI